MKNILNLQCRVLMLVVLLLLISPAAFAFGVTSPYWDTKPLVLHPGETKDFTLILQNMVGEKDLSFIATVNKGAEIASLINSSSVYNVPFGADDVLVNVRVTVPLKASFGEIDRIGISFVQVAEEEGKMVQISGAVATDIPVIISPMPSGNPGFFSTTVLIVVLGVVLSGAAIGYLLFRKREDSD